MFVRTDFYRAISFVVIAVLLFASVPANNLWWREAINSGHTLLFVFFTFVIHSQINTRMRFSNVFVIYLFVLIIGMLLGVVIEVLQSVGQREASLNDLYRDFLGIMTGLSLLSLFNTKNTHYQKIASIIMAAGFLLLALYPLLQLSWHYIERHNAFPVVIDFNANWSSSFVRFNDAIMIKVSASHQYDSHLRLVQFNPGNYPGISVIEPEPDWSNYHNLRLKIVSMNELSHYMTLRVHDYKHNQGYSDRFNKKLLIQPGLNEFIISLNQIRYAPADRELDLKNIAGLILFSGRLKKPLRFSVSYIGLE